MHVELIIMVRVFYHSILVVEYSVSCGQQLFFGICPLISTAMEETSVLLIKPVDYIFEISYFLFTHNSLHTGGEHRAMAESY